MLSSNIKNPKKKLTREVFFFWYKFNSVHTNAEKVQFTSFNYCGHAIFFPKL
jgi:hypothetical protein